MDIRGWGAALLDLVLPAECAGCAAPPGVGAWCARCVVRLGGPSWPDVTDDLTALAMGRYSGPLRMALLRYKERGRRDLAAPLAQLLLSGLDQLSDAANAPPGPRRDASVPPPRGPGDLAWPPGVRRGGPLWSRDVVGGWPESPVRRGGPLPPPAVVGGWPEPPVQRSGPLPPPDVAGGRPSPAAVTWLVPAPSRPAAARARGGDHVLRLARAIGAERHDVRVTPALALARRTRDSVGLDPAQRVANLEGRIFVRHGALPPPGSCVVLLDDVVTTGATLRACRSALRNAGVLAGSALVLCDATSARDDHEPLAAS